MTYREMIETHKSDIMSEMVAVGMVVVFGCCLIAECPAATIEQGVK